MRLPETYLIEVFRPEAKHILELLTKTNSEQENNELQSYYKRLADWGSRHLQKAGEIVLDKIELSYKDEVIKLGLAKRTKDLWGMINALIELMKKHNLNEKNAKIIQQTTLEILAGLSKMPIPKKIEDPKDPEPPEEDPEGPEPPEEDPEDPVSNKGKRDWTAERARRLNDAKKTNTATSEVLRKFYDDYYSQEYAELNPTKAQEIVAKLKSLDKVLTIEFNKLGYNSEVNPFAQFLKILIQKQPKIFEKLTLNNYGAIHNAFIERHITGNMLGNYNKGNILFCEDLYNKNGLDIIDYLDLQKQALDKAETNDKYSNIKNQLIAVLCVQQTSLSDSYKENIEKLLEPENAEKIVLPTTENAQVKSLLEIRELYQHIFGAAPKIKVNINDIVARAVNKGVVLSMVQRLLDQDDLERVYKKDVQALTAWLGELSYTRDKDKIETAKNILSEYSLDTATKRSLVIALQNYYNKNVRDKKAGS
jgi:hypothetical protein